MRSKGEPTASGDTDRPCSKKAPSYTYTFAGNGRIHSAVNHKDGQRSPKWLLKMSPLLSLLTQIRSVELRAWWQLWLHCHSYLHANYHLVFCDYLMNSGGKVVPLRKMKLPQKFMTKEKHKSLPARAWIANVLTQPTASNLHPQANKHLGAVPSFPPGVGSSSPIFWLRMCAGLGQAAAAGAAWQWPDCPSAAVNPGQQREKKIPV